jgi:NifU-like protein involved in Fe-S cluster formation
MAYSDKVIDHYENPRNVGSFAKDDPTVGTGMVGAPACGDVMKLQIKVDMIQVLLQMQNLKRMAADRLSRVQASLQSGSKAKPSTKQEQSKTPKSPQN